MGRVNPGSETQPGSRALLIGHRHQLLKFRHRGAVRDRFARHRHAPADRVRGAGNVERGAGVGGEDLRPCAVAAPRTENPN